MATIIEKLIVTLGLDSAPFKKGADDVEGAQKKTRTGSEKTRKAMEEDGKKTVESFRRMRNEVLALVASFVGLNAIREFTENITHSDASIGRMARTLGMNTSDLWVWEKAMKQFGVTAGETDSALSSLTDLQQSWIHGAPLTGEMSKALVQAHIDVVKFHSSTTTATDKLMMLAEGFKEVGPAAAEDLAKTLGLGRNMVAALARGPEAVKAMLDAQRRLGPLTDEQANAAQRRENEWENLQTRIEGFQRYLVSTFWPIVEPILLKMMHWWDVHQVEVIDRVKQAITFLGDELKKVPWQEIGDDITAIWKAADGAAQSFGGWGKSLKLILETWLALKAAGITLGGIALVRTALGVGGGAAAVAGGGALSAAATGLGISGTGLLYVVSAIGAAIVAGLLYATRDHGDVSGAEAIRSSQGGRGYMVTRNPYQPRPAAGGDTSNSTVNHVDNVTINAPGGDPNAITTALSRFFTEELPLAAQAQQGGR